MAELTPLDILGKGFGRSFRGCPPADVQEFLVQIAGAMEGLLRERGDLRLQLHRLEHELTTFREREHALQDALVSAQRAADRTLEEARGEAQRIVDEGQQLADRLVEDAHSRAHNIETVISDLRSRRREARADLIRLVELLQGVIHDDQQLERSEPTSPQLALLQRKRNSSGEGQR
jgi:cell division initiation protein